MAKKVIKEYSSEMKFAKNIYATDVIFIGTYLVSALLLGELFVADTLRIPFYIASAIFALLLVRKSKQNPKIRNYRAIIFMFKAMREKPVYSQAFPEDLMKDETPKKGE